MAPIIRVENVHFTYQPEGGQPIHALRGINLTVEPGEYLAIVGHNGSGKSTLAKHLNALLLPTQGDVWVRDWNTRDRRHTLEIRATVGMVFQTPDNQIVATIVEEDVAFGPENLGVPHDELVQRVDWSLEQVRMIPYRHRAPHLLSGGQKQRVCIAGVLAMKPEVLVLDESTAMLDPRGRAEVLETVRRLNREAGVTVIAITHFMHEALDADRVIVMADGQIALEGPPRAVFSQVERLRELQLDVPPLTALARTLHRHLPDFPADILTLDEMVEAVRRQLNGRPLAAALPSPPPPTDTGEPLAVAEHLVHDYMRGTPLAVRALHDVNLEIRPGEIVGILGHTGSGKSTAVQHLNGLLRPHGGRVVVLGHDLGDNRVDVRALRRRVGLVFQFPEAQLFERYVGDDIAYGPRNLKLSREEVRERVRRAMAAVGLDFDTFKDRFTFSLSGGEMRRVALAGVLALEPEILILDEPTAGLDPQGRRQLWEQILKLHDTGMALVIISHNMEELAEVCHRLYVIAEGRTVLEGTPAQIFGQPRRLREMGLDVPVVTSLVDRLAEARLVEAAPPIYTVEQATRWLGEALHGKL
ncbi:energy-coupling factor transporter ATPase [Litorilinea aerophila]|uniref:Energy-coupling factor transporter ATPase n=1 Tax=Litorilinea aerophila TaxID=1204385 RepID=A0A540V937_9CHLR|nr:energy-coupling factor transporter ATPase [Litorilinea aerophila]MCC9078832.1 energy-coupling factor transporter ATPase [Litorilinea aerophila]